MPMILTQEVVKLFGDIGRDVCLAALLTHVSRDILDDEQLLIAPDFQHGFARFQFTIA